jgi:hypothetical protein
MDTERVKMANPIIQIGDEIREMTDEEHADHLAMLASAVPQEVE